jgi:hypothetical protein
MFVQMHYVFASPQSSSMKSQQGRDLAVLEQIRIGLTHILGVLEDVR